MNLRLLKKIILIVSACLLLLACNKPLASSQFQEHPASQLIVSNAKLKPNSGIWFIDWSAFSLLTLVVTVREGQWPVYMSDIHSGSLIPVTRNGTELWSSSPKLSPNGSYIAYQSIREHLGIYVAKVDQQLDDSFEITDDHLVVDISTISSLDWSSDSQRLAILTMVEGQLRLYIYNLLDDSIQELLRYEQDNVDYVDGLSWSPDGSKVAFVVKYSLSENDAVRVQSDVFIYYIYENRLVRLTSSDNLSEASPSWFPKGDILIYTSTDGIGSALISSHLVFLTKDGKCTKIVPRLEGMESPSWSPDGSQIAYISKDGLEIMDVEKIIPQDFLTVNGLCR